MANGRRTSAPHGGRQSWRGLGHAGWDEGRRKAWMAAGGYLGLGFGIGLSLWTVVEPWLREMAANR